MDGYTKLFKRILDSTIWREDDQTRILWITMLAMADQDGIVQATIPGLADRARISLAECESALERFQKPDKYSWSKEEEGRRIKVIDGGWFLINHAKYRALMSKEEQMEKTRIRVERFRLRQKALHTVTTVTSNDCNDIAEAEAEAEAVSQKRSARTHFEIPCLGEITAYCEERDKRIDPQQFFNYYTSNGWRVGRNAMKDWRAAVRTWEKNGVNNGTYQQGGKQVQRESRARQVARTNLKSAAALGWVTPLAGSVEVEGVDAGGDAPLDGETLRLPTGKS